MNSRLFGNATTAGQGLLFALVLAIGLSPTAGFPQGDAAPSTAAPPSTSSASAQGDAAPSDAASLSASSPSVQRGKEVFKSVAQCQFCHGWDGGGDSSEYGGNAPSLRATQLDRDQIAETVKCGRPDAGMPYHDRNAYTADDKCYGMTTADLGTSKMPLKPIAFLSQRDIDAVADYVATVVKGEPPVPTHAECVAFFGSETRACNRYK
jgi:mono/diheme cytochrome c family protein